MDRSIDLSIYRSVDLSICRSVDLSTCLSVYLSICLSIYRSIDLSISLSLSLSTVLRVPRKSARSYEVLHPSCKSSLETWRSPKCNPSQESLPWPPNISDEHVSCIAPATRHASLRILFKCPAPAIVFGNATKQIAKRIGTRPSALHSTFHFWRKSRWIASFLCCELRKLRSLADLLRFWFCQVRKLRKSRRIVSFLTLSSSKTEEVSQNSFVSSLQEDRQTDRQAGRQTDRPLRLSKSAPRPSVFCTFDFDMCFAPQRHALFRHVNFQKRSDTEVLCAFWYGNMLRTTTACTFSTSQLPKVLWTWGAFYIWLQIVLRATTACTFSTCDLPKVLENGVFCTSLLRILFDPPEPQIIGKAPWIATFLPFRAPASSLPLTLSLLWSSFFFSSLIFSDSSRLCFSMCPYCRNFLRIVIYCNSN